MEILDYIERARREPSRENIEEMWRAIFMLKAWYFLPAASSEGPNRPMALEIDGEDWVAAFTNVRRYRAFAEEAGRVDEGGEVHALVLDPAESLERFVEVADAIQGVVFNPGGEAAVRAPTDALVAYARRFGVPYGPADP